MKIMRFTLCAFALLASHALFAADGQVLINQSTVTAAGGFPYHITQAGSYKLSGNLVASLDKAAIQFDVGDVFLDLNGFNVKCTYDQNVNSDAPCFTDGGASLVRITVRNGSID